jgi:hypothetical protein
MADPQVFPIGSFVTGITRLRYKGGASPQSLYDLQNGYVDQAGMPTNRPGTTFNTTLPAGTKGLCAFQGKLHVFALSAKTMPSGYVCDILIHPDPSFAGTLDRIYFAKPFLGFLYVVAGFSDGNVYHYWLQSKGTWKADTQYLLTDAAQPTVPNGFIYKPTSTDNPNAWMPSTQYLVGDVVQPTTYNGYKYTAIEVDGTGAASGTTEPSWIASVGAQVIEDVDAPTSSGTAPPPAPSSGGSPAGPRYDGIFTKGSTSV